MTARAAPIWPFPGANGPWWEAYPPHNLPPPRFAVGDRVRTPWGGYTVLVVRDYEHFGSRSYHCRPDGSSSPPGFGHTWGEDDMEPLVEQPAAPEPVEVFHAAPAPRAQVEQMELF
jgi:hypothetical protein